LAQDTDFDPASKEAIAYDILASVEVVSISQLLSPGRTTMAKPCAISRRQFRENAKPIPIVINNVPLLAEVKEFSTGSFGWYLNGKLTIEIGGTPVPVQIGMNLTVVGSKEAPREE
jgi:hypothetical protein